MYIVIHLKWPIGSSDIADMGHALSVSTVYVF